MKNLSNLFKIILALFSLILFTHLLSSLINLMKTSNLNDFQVYFEAAGASLSTNPYEKEYFSSYNYPPAATIFFLPLTLLPYKLAELLWFIASIFSLFLSVFLLFDLFFKRASFTMKFFTSTLLLRTFPARFTLILGQINLFILLILVLSFYFYQKKRMALAGILIGVAGAIKLTPFMLLFFYFLKKEKQALIAGFFAFLALNLFSLIIFGPQQFFYFFKIVFPLLLKKDISRDITTTYINQSLEVFLSRLGILSFLIKWPLVLLSLGLVVREMILKNKPLENFKSFSILLLVTTVFIPAFSWQHHFVFLFPALLTLFFYWKRNFNLLRGFLLFFFLCSFYFHFKDPHSPFLKIPLLASHNFLSAVGLLVTLLVL